MLIPSDCWKWCLARSKAGKACSRQVRRSSEQEREPDAGERARGDDRHLGTAWATLVAPGGGSGAASPSGHRQGPSGSAGAALAPSSRCAAGWQSPPPPATGSGSSSSPGSAPARSPAGPTAPTDAQPPLAPPVPLGLPECADTGAPLATAL